MGEKLDFSIGLPTGEQPVKTKTAATDSWNINFNNGNANNNNRNNTNNVLPVVAIEKRVYDIPFADVLKAYAECVKQKKSKRQCIEFSMNAEQELVQLYQELCEGTYTPSKSYCFIVERPVKREIIASAFRDRIVHHLIKLYINPLYERWYHECGNVSKNCRKGEGPQSAVAELEQMIKEESDNYTTDCWIFSFDIYSYFMSIDKTILWEMLEQFIRAEYKEDNMDFVLWLVRTTVFHSPQQDCHRISPISAWDGLPPSKSLRYNDPNIGIAPGNLSSQDEANFYLTPVDYFIVKVKGFDKYVRFMDDGKIVSRDLAALRGLQGELNKFMKEQLHIQLHPKKCHITHYSKGIKFVGFVVKPGRKYISNRILGHFYDTIHHYNQIAENGDAEKFIDKFAASINSYWGMMVHANSYSRRMKSAKQISPIWFKYIYITARCTKVVIRPKYKAKNRIRRKVKSQYYTQLLTPEMF